ncbi:MAG TPA: TetR/AcrR family transcriptional regulator [Frankiaceae bacterium]|jgi:AcrR family transcriptional regulator|nr:TetR/AcrR family transcriptional regulator [Frankiaceae bacterium]
MTPSTRPRSTRDRPAKAPLSRDAIVEAALAILESEGLESLSMRRVAAALDTGAGSLYVYVEGREGLLEAVFDRIVATIKLEKPDAKRWRAQIHSLLTRSRDALVAHPGMAAATMVDPPRTEVSLRMLENMLGILLAGGLDPQDAAWAADVLAAQVTYAAIEAELRRTDPNALAEEVEANFSRLPEGKFPLITAYTAQLVAGDVDERFRFAIDVVLDGVLARTARR